MAYFTDLMCHCHRTPSDEEAAKGFSFVANALEKSGGSIEIKSMTRKDDYLDIGDPQYDGISIVEKKEIGYIDIGDNGD